MPGGGIYLERPALPLLGARSKCITSGFSLLRSFWELMVGVLGTGTTVEVAISTDECWCLRGERLREWNMDTHGNKFEDAAREGGRVWDFM